MIALWNTTIANWTGSSTVYADGNDVTFDDSATGLTTVTIFYDPTGGFLGVTPNSITFNNTLKPYTLNALFFTDMNGVTTTGAILGSTELTKLGSNSLTITNSNLFTGNTNLDAGSILLGDPTSLSPFTPLGFGTVLMGNTSGSAPVNLLFSSTAASLVMPNPMVARDTTSGTITIGGQNTSGVDTFNGQITLGSTPNVGKSVTLSATGGGEVDFTSPIVPNGSDTTAGVNIVRAGSTGVGNVLMSGNSTYHGGTVVNTGARLIVNSTTALGSGPVTMMNGAIMRVTALGGDFAAAGFGSDGMGAGMTVNSDNIFTSAFPAANTLQLSDGSSGTARSAFFNTLLPISYRGNGFLTSFIYTPSGNQFGDGFTLTIQNDSRGPTALGGIGQGLGYGTGTNSGGNSVQGLLKSVSLEFNINPNLGDGFSLGINGGTPANGGALAFMPALPVIFGSGDPIQVQIGYLPSFTALVIGFTDTVTGDAYPAPGAPNAFLVNLQSILGSDSAYVGFTGGTSSANSIQQISNFTYAVPQAGPVTVPNNVILNPATSSTILSRRRSLPAPVTLGSLTVSSGGASTLTVMAGSNLDLNTSFALTFGSVNLNSNITFNLVNNGTGQGILTVGAINDGGTPRIINITGNGAVTVAAAATSLVSGTTVNLTGIGTSLNLNFAGALGSLAQVSTTFFTTLNIGANQTFSSLNAAGTVSLNAGTLTVGNAENLDSLISGAIVGTSRFTAKGGTGTLTLTGANTFSGGTTISAGTVVAGSPAALEPAR